MLHKKTGAALVITLWVLVMMGVLALSFSQNAMRDALGTRNLRDSVSARYMAISALDKALLYIATDPDPAVDFLDESGLFRTDEDRPSISGTAESEDGTVELVVSDEEALLNLNLLNNQMMDMLLQKAGAKDDERASIVDAIMDWRDSDDLHRLQGVEDEYYVAFGYKAHNANFEVPEELLLVKGVSAELYHGAPAGDQTEEGLSKFITTWGSALNINTAPTELAEVIGLNPSDVNLIDQARQSGKPLRTLQHNLAGNLRTFTNSFRITVKATTKGAPQAYKITAIVRREGSELKTIYWKEDFDYETRRA